MAANANVNVHLRGDVSRDIRIIKLGVGGQHGLTIDDALTLYGTLAQLRQLSIAIDRYVTENAAA